MAALFSADERDYYWWRCTELSCPVRGGAPAYVPLLKVHLKVLFEKANATIEASEIAPALKVDCRKKLSSIFRDKTVTLTSLNVKSLQCAALFTEILEMQGKVPDPNFTEYRGGPDPKVIYKEAKRDPRGFYTFEGCKAFIIASRAYDDLIIDEETGGAVCCPNLRNKIVCVLLGELTVEEIVRTYADHIYICGLTFDKAYADGFLYTPLEFLHHDVVHASNRRSGRGTASDIGYRRLKTFVNYLDTPNDLTPEQSKACWFMLFMLTHEVGSEYLMDSARLSQIVGEGYAYNWILERWKNPNDLGGLLMWYLGIDEGALTAMPNEEILPRLRAAGDILSEKWNALFAEGGPAGGVAAPARVVPEGYENRLTANAAIWNAFGFEAPSGAAGASSAAAGGSAGRVPVPNPPYLGTKVNFKYPNPKIGKAYYVQTPEGWKHSIYQSMNQGRFSFGIKNGNFYKPGSYFVVDVSQGEPNIYESTAPDTATDLFIMAGGGKRRTSRKVKKSKRSKKSKRANK
jgi:hypothetical protein